MGGQETPGRSDLPAPIPGLLVLSRPAATESNVRVRQLWPAAGVPDLDGFVPARHVLLDSDHVDAVREPTLSNDNQLITVVTGRIEGTFLDHRADGNPRQQIPLDAGTSIFVPAGVAFGFRVLTGPAVLSILHSRSPGRPTNSQDDPGSGPFRVLFVCTANICRSAYADIAAGARPHPGLEFASAGVHALVDHPIDPPMAACLPTDVDSTGHRARQLTREAMVDADLVLTMAGEHRRYILEEWPDLGRKTFVLGHVAREIQQAPTEVTLADLTDHLWRRRTTDRHDDVADPYRRGPEAAAAAARKIDAFLDALLDGLSRISRRDAGTDREAAQP